MRSKISEWIGFGLAGLAFLAGVGEFARYGWTYSAIALIAGAGFSAGLTGLIRQQRRLAQFKEKYPGWRIGGEAESGPHRPSSRRRGTPQSSTLWGPRRPESRLDPGLRRGDD